MNTLRPQSKNTDRQSTRSPEGSHLSLAQVHNYNLGTNAARVSSALNELKQCATKAHELATISLRMSRDADKNSSHHRQQELAQLSLEAQAIGARHVAESAALAAWNQRWAERIARLERNLRSPYGEIANGNPSGQIDPALLQTVSRRFAQFEKAIASVDQKIEQAVLLLAKLGHKTNPSAKAYSYKGAPVAIVQTVGKQLADVAQQLTAEHKLLTRIWHSQALPVIAFFTLSACSYLVGLVIWLSSNDLFFGTVVGCILAVVAVAVLITWMIKIGKRQSHIAELSDEVSSLMATHTVVEDLGKKHLNPEAYVAKHASQILQAEASVAQAMRMKELEREQWRARKNARLDQLAKRQNERNAQSHTELARSHQQELAEHQARCQECERAAAARIELELKRQQSLVAERQHAIEKTVADTIGHLHDDLERANGTLRLRHRDWSDSGWANWEIPAAFPVAIPCARLSNRVADFIREAELPAQIHTPKQPESFQLSADLVLPDAGHLLVEGNDGLTVIHQAMLRLLVGSPLGKIRFSLVDPLGLGNNFAQFLRLRDADENIVGAKVWTSQVEVERILANLSYHAEKVIQKYLRDKYATLAEYNAIAGDLAEPYQVLVIADMPHGFSDLALERLASLVKHGPRCGIFVWVHGSTTVPFPPMIKRSDFMECGVVLQHGDSGWQVAHSPLREWDCRVEGMPALELMHHLLDEIGQRTSQSATIALPLTASLPDISRRWQGNSAEELRIPIGRCGADELQEMVLGHGTAQHVLIGGRTGSGKSTLLHSIICSGAWYFPPEQLEFYLIDFKKGVEFKVYATTKLPHARVVAVESDREFGLSVLRAIDKELDERGRRFRAIGAQDLAAYRQMRPTEVMPRTLLVIDEFQEMFVEDDAIAHSGAMLLDRFVRQGRAFGIHVILGSQSLGGSSALARSTIGQIGVRIALQCSEADSQLILSDANIVAQLLERPGEAIYNDRSGLKEGNSPFQVFWLDSSEQQALLANLPHGGQAIPRVFEGSAPVQLHENHTLQSLISTAGEAESLRCWLGEPNSLAGPCQIAFGPGSEGNLVVIGHHREASMSMVIAAMCALTASKSPTSLRLRIIDGEGSDDRASDLVRRMATELPHDIKMLAASAAAGEIAALQNECTDHGRATIPTVVFVLGLQRIRDLRMSDDFSFSGKRGPGEHFADLLTHGPDVGINTWIWCDSVGNLNRALTRSTQRLLGHRIAFQMSSGDSSDLIDDGSASHLGLYHALSVNLASGSRVKFRPYSLPSVSEMDDLIQAINHKWRG